MSKHRHERFRPGFAVVRLDEHHIAGTPREELVYIKEVLLSEDAVVAEVARLNALNGDKGSLYFWQYTQVEQSE
jgi:hypothetical protein